jgi:TATA-binding protein-associated factor
MSPRPYQRDGISWLAFLRRFGLHGILADDMGLGKTLQVCAALVLLVASPAQSGSITHGMRDIWGLQPPVGIPTNATSTRAPHPRRQATAIMAASAQERAAAAAAAAPVGAAAPPAPHLPSLVVCPATLVGHWAHEIGKYVGPEVLSPLEISGAPSERRAAAAKLLPGRHGVAIMSYESLRSEAEWAAGIAWDYVILDEGHVIRSSKSRLAQATKQLRCAPAGGGLRGAAGVGGPWAGPLWPGLLALAPCVLCSTGCSQPLTPPPPPRNLL